MTIRTNFSVIKGSTITSHGRRWCRVWTIQRPGTVSRRCPLACSTHTPEVHFGEAPVFHALQQMRAEFQLPCPPWRPSAFAHLQAFSAIIRSTSSCADESTINARPNERRGITADSGKTALLRFPMKRFLPRTTDFSSASRNFASRSRIGIRRWLQAFDQQAGKRRPIALGELQRVPSTTF